MSGIQHIMYGGGGSGGYGQLPMPPSNALASKYGYNSLRVEWDNFATALGGFKVGAKANGIPTFEEVKNDGISLAANARHYDFSNLAENTNYGFRIINMNSDGDIQTAIPISGSTCDETTNYVSHTTMAQLALPDALSGASSYFFYRSKNGDCFVCSSSASYPGVYALNVENSTWVQIKADGYSHRYWHEDELGNLYFSSHYSSSPGLWKYLPSTNSCIQVISTGYRYDVSYTAADGTFFICSDSTVHYLDSTTGTFVALSVVYSSSYSTGFGYFSEDSNGNVYVSTTSYNSGSTYGGLWRFNLSTHVWTRMITSNEGNFAVYEDEDGLFVTSIYIYEYDSETDTFTSIGSTRSSSSSSSSNYNRLYRLTTGQYFLYGYTYVYKMDSETHAVSSTGIYYDGGGNGHLDLGNGAVLLWDYNYLYDFTTNTATAMTGISASRCYRIIDDVYYIMSSTNKMYSYDPSTRTLTTLSSKSSYCSTVRGRISGTNYYYGVNSTTNYPLLKFDESTIDFTLLGTCNYPPTSLYDYTSTHYILLGETSRSYALKLLNKETEAVTASEVYTGYYLCNSNNSPAYVSYNINKVYDLAGREIAWDTPYSFTYTNQDEYHDNYFLLCDATNNSIILNVNYEVVMNVQNTSEVSFSWIFPNATEYYVYRLSDGTVMMSSNDANDKGIYALNASSLTWAKVHNEGYGYRYWYTTSYGTTFAVGAGDKYLKWRGGYFDEVNISSYTSSGTYNYDTFTPASGEEIGNYLWFYEFSNGDVMAASSSRARGVLLYRRSTGKALRILYFDGFNPTNTAVMYPTIVEYEAGSALLCIDSTLFDYNVYTSTFGATCRSLGINGWKQFVQLSDDSIYLVGDGQNLAEQGGLQYYDAETDSMVTINDDIVGVRLLENSNGDVYYCGFWSVPNYQPANNTLMAAYRKLYKRNADMTFTQIYDALGDLKLESFADTNGNIFLITSDLGGSHSLFRINGSTVTVLQSGLTEGNLDVFLTDEDGGVYVSGNSGLKKYDTSTNTFTSISTSGTNFESIIETTEARYFIPSVDTAYILVYDKTLESYTDSLTLKGGKLFGKEDGLCSFINNTDDKLYSTTTSVNITGEYGNVFNLPSCAFAIDTTNKKLLVNH